jgi:iron complex transport system substrate-binding protein
MTQSPAAPARRLCTAPARRRFLALAGALPAIGLARHAGAQAAPRVVSIGGAVTEIVYRIGGERHLVATDTTSTYPAAAAALPKIGYQRTLSAEGILALNPTLLLTAPEAGPPAALSQLETAGVKIVRATGDYTFDSLVSNVDVVAKSLNLAAAGRKLDDTLRGDWKATRTGIRTAGSSPKVLFVFSHAATNVQVSGEGTAAAAMIALAGGVNAMSGFKGYRPLSSEGVIAAAPDVILCTREGVEALGGVDALLNRPGIALTPAGKAGRVLYPDALLLLGFGPRLPQAVRELAQSFGTFAG